jgi:hypothetical protein
MTGEKGTIWKEDVVGPLNLPSRRPIRRNHENHRKSSAKFIDGTTYLCRDSFSTGYSKYHDMFSSQNGHHQAELTFKTVYKLRKL